MTPDHYHRLRRDYPGHIVVLYSNGHFAVPDGSVQASALSPAGVPASWWESEHEVMRERVRSKGLDFWVVSGE